MKQRIFGLMLTTGLVAAAAATAIAAATLSAGDKEFVTKAAQGGMAEVTLGTIATKQGHSRPVKAFGAQMVQDHGKANKELIALAKKLGVKLPKAVSPEQQTEIARLTKLKGEAFDKAYMETMVKDHKQDVADFEKEAKSGENAQVKAWAAKTLPTLQLHLKMAEGNARATEKEGTKGHEGHMSGHEGHMGGHEGTMGGHMAASPAPKK